MKVTRHKLIEKYKYCNEKYFGNELPNGIYLIPYEKYKHIGGFVSISEKCDKNDEEDLGIFINSDYDYTEETLEMALLHEMVHEYLSLFHKEEYDKEDPHGEMFKKKCEEISDNGNLKSFFRSDIIDNLPLRRKHPLYVIKVKGKDGKTLLGRMANKTWVNYFRKHFSNGGYEMQVTFYETKSHALLQFDENDAICLRATEVDENMFNEKIKPWLKEIK